MSLFTKHKQTHRLHKQIYGYQRGKVRRDKLGILESHLSTTADIYKIDNQQGPSG